MRRLFSMLLLATMLISLAACSSAAIPQSQQTETPEIQEYQYTSAPRADNIQASLEQSAEVYGKERLEIPGDQAYVYWGMLTGEKIFSYGVDSYNNTVFYLLDPSNFDVQMLQIKLSDSVYLLGQSYDDVQPILTINESGEYILNLFADSQLAEQTVLKLPDQYSDDIIVGITVIPEHFIVELSSEIIALSRNSEFEKSFGSFSGATLCSITRNGHLVIAGETKEDMPPAKSVTKVNLFDFNLDLLDAYESETQFEAFCTGNVDGEILALKNGIIYSYHYESGEISSVIDAVSSGMNSNKVFYAADDKYITFQKGIPALWSVLNDEDITVLTMATYHLNYSLELLIDSFNESSADCKIKVIDYASFEDSSDSKNGLMRLNADIVAGFTPDLYDLTNLHTQSFIRNGLLENMESFFTQCGIEPEKLVSSAYEQLKMEDGVYYMMPSFTIISVIGNRDMLEEDAHLTPDRFFSVAAELSPDKLFGPDLTREAFLRYTLLFNSEEYFNEKADTCNFTSSGFGRFLEFAASLPEEVDYSQIDSQDISRAYAGEQMLILSSMSGDLVSLFSYYDTAFEGKAEYVGFPSTLSSGIALAPSSLIGVSSASLHKEQAIDFIAFTVSDYCQSNAALSGLPINQNALEKRVDYWASEYEKFGKSLVTVYNGARIELSGNASAEYSKEHIFAAIDSADTLAIFDDTLFYLIFTESQSYFNGKTSLQQCLDTLQSKVQLYLAERS